MKLKGELLPVNCNAQSGQDTAALSMIDDIRKSRYRILVIDDNDSFRRSFCFKLKRVFSASVDDVNSGEAALERLQSNSFDFIFVDLMMPPGMSGIETYRQIQRLNTITPVVMMSAYPESEEWQAAQDLPNVTLLHKPFTDDALMKIFGANRSE